MESRFLSRSIAVRETASKVVGWARGFCTHKDSDVSSRSVAARSSSLVTWMKETGSGRQMTPIPATSLEDSATDSVYLSLVKVRPEIYKALSITSTLLEEVRRSTCLCSCVLLVMKDWGRKTSSGAETRVTFTLLSSFDPTEVGLAAS